MDGTGERAKGLDFKPEAGLLKVPGSPEIHEVNVTKHISSLPENQFFVYSPTAVHKLGFEDEAFGLRAVSDHDTSIVLADLRKVRIPETCDEITVFGAGRAIDIAKYLAYLHGKKLNIIPSMLSTNALGTPFGCYDNSIEDKTKTTLHTGYASKIFVDFDYLEKLEKGSLYGLADVLSISTALHDWDMAVAQDPSVVNDSVYREARKIVNSCFKQIETNRLDTRTVFNLIVNSAYITGLHGSGRPESGSEHIFSKYIELDTLRRGSYIMHGKSVGLGMLLMATLQQNEKLEEIFSAVRGLGFLAEFEPTKEVLRQRATEVLTQIEPHPVRYSVVNAQLDNLRNPSFSGDLSNEVIKKLFATQET